MKARQVITDQMIEDLLVTALEGGSNYWYYLPDTRMVDESNIEDPLSIRIHKVVLDGKEVPVTDAETMEFENEEGDEYDEPKGDLLGMISKANYERAEELLLDQYPYRLGQILSEDWDAETADVWFQLVVMGEVVYG